jgi:2'-5' RNA ligase
MKATGYSLWLVPRADSAEGVYLRTCIKALSDELHAPVFEPHVTLLGGFNGPHNYVSRSSRMIAAQLASIEISFTDVGSKGIYAQAFLAGVKQTPQLMISHDLARLDFDADKKPYFPHLSLSYGDLDETKVATLRATLLSKYPDFKARASFTARHVELWLTDGDIAEWRKIESFLLG